MKKILETWSFVTKQILSYIIPNFINFKDNKSYLISYVLQLFSSLVVTLTIMLLVTRLSCMFPHQGRHAPCPHYLMKERATLFPRAASCVAEMAVRAAYSGHQTRAPGRRLFLT